MRRAAAARTSPRNRRPWPSSTGRLFQAARKKPSQHQPLICNFNNTALDDPDPGLLNRGLFYYANLTSDRQIKLTYMSVNL